jgi:glycosyltransferase involved in cell wall biosynthesis
VARGRKVVVSYIGTLGNAAHLWTLLDAAKRLEREAPDVSIALVGQGAEREALEKRAAREDLANVHFHGEQPRGEVPGIISATDICLVLLRKDDVFKTVIPSKMLEFMACGRPVILGVDGQARTILEAASAGFFVEPQNPDALAAAVRWMIAR